MDPDDNLQEQRRIVERFNRESTYEDMDELVELVQSLDEWISKGGFLPAVWAVGLKLARPEER